jgi:SecY interacting protein Syd
LGEIARLLLALLERGSAVPVEHDPDWPSPCAVLPPDADGMVRWRPVPMDPSAAFVGVPLRPELQEFFGSFWGRSGGGRHSGEVASVRVAWNSQHLAQMIQTAVHQLDAGVPVCVAVTDSDWYFGVDNATGAVWLCEPGHPPVRQVASSLAAFLAEVS